MFSRGMLLFWILCWTMEVMHCQSPIVDQTTPADSWQSRIGLTGNPHNDKPLLEKERDRLELDINGTKLERDNAKAKVTGLEEEQKTLNGTISELEEELAKLENNTANAGKVKERYDEEVASKTSMIATINTTLKVLNGNISNTDDNIKNLGGNYDALNKTIIDLQKNVSEEMQINKRLVRDFNTATNNGEKKEDTDGHTRDYWQKRASNLQTEIGNSVERKRRIDAQITQEYENLGILDSNIRALRDMKDTVKSVYDSLVRNRTGLIEYLEADALLRNTSVRALNMAKVSQQDNVDKLDIKTSELTKLNNITLPKAEEEVERIQNELSNKEKELREVKEAIEKAEVNSVYWVEPTTVTGDPSNGTESTEQTSDNGKDWGPIIKLVFIIAGGAGGLAVAVVVIGGGIWLIVRCCKKYKKNKEKKDKAKALAEKASTEPVDDPKKEALKKEEKPDVKVEPLKKNEPDVKVEPLKKDAPDVKVEPLKKDEPDVKVEPLKKDEPDVKVEPLKKKEADGKEDNGQPPSSEAHVEIDVVIQELDDTNDHNVFLSAVFIEREDDVSAFTEEPPSLVDIFPPYSYETTMTVHVSNFVLRHYWPLCSVTKRTNAQGKFMKDAVPREIKMSNVPWKSLMENTKKLEPVLRSTPPPSYYVHLHKQVFAFIMKNRKPTPKLLTVNDMKYLLANAMAKVTMMKPLVELTGPTFVISALEGHIPSLLRILVTSGNGTPNGMYRHNSVLNGSLMRTEDPEGSLTTLFYYLTLMAIAPKPVVWLRGKNEKFEESILKEFQLEYGKKDGKMLNDMLVELYSLLPFVARCGGQWIAPGGAPKKPFTIEEIQSIQRPILDPRSNPFVWATTQAQPASCAPNAEAANGDGYYSPENAKNQCKVLRCHVMITGTGSSEKGYRLNGTAPTDISLTSRIPLDGNVSHRGSFYYIDEVLRGHIIVLIPPFHPFYTCCGIFSRDKKEAPGIIKIRKNERVEWQKKIDDQALRNKK